MEVVKQLFDEVYVIKNRTRDDSRGTMIVGFDESVYEECGFEVKQSRIYTMPDKGTFFGIHYYEDDISKMVSVIKGRGMDYIVDLRKDSPTYLKWESVELSGDNCKAVIIPKGFGHAFISLEDDTIQTFSINKGGYIPSKGYNYRDEKIGLEFDIPISKIAEYDENAEFVKE